VSPRNAREKTLRTTPARAPRIALPKATLTPLFWLMDSSFVEQAAFLGLPSMIPPPLSSCEPGKVAHQPMMRRSEPAYLPAFHRRCSLRVPTMGEYAEGLRSLGGHGHGTILLACGVVPGGPALGSPPFSGVQPRAATGGWGGELVSRGRANRSYDLTRISKEGKHPRDVKSWPGWNPEIWSGGTSRQATIPKNECNSI
jgi:hypothetical protein